VKPVRARAWISEFIGTTLLLFAATVIARWLFGSDSPLAREVPALAGRLAIDGVVTGAVIGLLIISPLGRSSGGHFNPAVTVTMWLLRGIHGGDVGAYVGAQLAGSVIGVLAGRAVLGPVLAAPPVDYAALRPASGWTGGAMFAGEALSLALLMAVVVAFLARPSLARWSPAAVAVTVAVLILLGGLTSGGSFNPARQLGPLVFAGLLGLLWAYLVGPVIGSLLVAVVIRSVGLPHPLTCSLCGTPPRDIIPDPLAPSRQPSHPGRHRPPTVRRRSAARTVTITIYGHA